MKTPNKQPDVEALGTVIGAIDPLADDEKLWVLQTAASRYSLTMTTPSGGGTATNRIEIPPGTDPSQTGDKVKISPKDFLRLKNPRSDVQRISCLAYYLTKYRNTSRFKTQQLTELNSESKWHNFSNPTVAVNNARKAKYLTPAGGGDKQLTNSGEDLVDALPDQEKVKALLSTSGKRKKHGRKKK